MSSEADEESLDLFQEPTDFYQPEKQATFASHQLLSGKELTVRLVGHNPLWVSHALDDRHAESIVWNFRAFYALASNLLEVFQKVRRSDPAFIRLPTVLCYSQHAH
jgi:hypothetical protein